MTVRNALLGLLAQRPRHGYELHAAFLALAGGEEIWEVQPAQIYTTLGRLEEAGLVTEQAIAKDRGPEKRIYAITDEGRAELAEWFGTSAPSRHERDDAFVKLMVAIATGADPYQVIRVQRTALYRELHAITGLRQRYDQRTALGRVLLLDKAVMQLESELRWLDMVEARLEEVRRQPQPEPVPKPRGRPRRREVRRTGTHPSRRMPREEGTTA
jgi:DNA-binding PadR family transcriptional regulator